jgi:TetR/AcrR family transcriptional repressor of nem operon
MARNREFETAIVLDKVMNLFWAGGYNAVSTQELINLCGLSKSSLYGAFGDKRQLFIRVLEQYRDRVADSIIGALDNATAIKPAIRKIFGDILRQALTDKDQKGCFLVNSGVELTPQDKDIARIVRRHRAKVEEAFVRAIKKGIAIGEIPANKDAATLSRLFCTTINGMYVDAKYLNGRKPFEDMVEMLLKMLE